MKKYKFNDARKMKSILFSSFCGMHMLTRTRHSCVSMLHHWMNVNLPFNKKANSHKVLSFLIVYIVITIQPVFQQGKYAH